MCHEDVLISILTSGLQGNPALVTFVTAGYPTQDDTVPILLAMQKGGADIIELGMPFSDPIADGPAIQETNTVRGVTILGRTIANSLSDCSEQSYRVSYSPWTAP